MDLDYEAVERWRNYETWLGELRTLGAPVRAEPDEKRADLRAFFRELRVSANRCPSCRSYSERPDKEQLELHRALTASPQAVRLTSHANCASCSSHGRRTTARSFRYGMNAMHDGMGAMSAEMRSYRDTMNHAATLAGARDACTTHTRSVDRMLDDMQHALGTVGCSMMER